MQTSSQRNCRSLELHHSQLKQHLIISKKPTQIMEGILYIQLQKECSTQIPQASFSLYVVQPMLKFAKALNGREMVQCSPGFNALTYVPWPYMYTRSVNLSKILLLNLQEKFGEQKMSLLTGLKHSLCCYQI